MPQFSTALRNAMLEAHEIIANGQSLAGGTGSGGSVTGTAAQPKLQIWTGSMPANCAAAATGTKLLEITLPADWAGNASAGAKALAGTWSGTAIASGTAGYYRIVDNAGTTCHEQGLVAQSVSLTTNALTAANGNVLNFASTTGVAVGMNVTGTGIVAGTTVVAVGGSTVTLSQTSTAGVSNSTSITFDGDISLNNTSINSGQTVTISSKTITAGNA